MGRAPCCDKANVKRGPWSPEEDAKLKSYIHEHGTGGNWIALPHKIGLKRCGKSCRLRWLNYLRPDIKHGGFSDEEDNIICSLYLSIGSRWSIIAAQLPGRTDNDIKNYWNTRLKKKLMGKQRKEQKTRRTTSNTTAIKQEMKREKEEETFMASNPLGIPYWPELHIPTIPQVNNSILLEDKGQESIRKFLVTLGGKFSDHDDDHQQQQSNISANLGYPFGISSSIQGQAYDNVDSINNLVTYPQLPNVCLSQAFASYPADLSEMGYTNIPNYRLDGSLMENFSGVEMGSTNNGTSSTESTSPWCNFNSSVYPPPASMVNVSYESCQEGCNKFDDLRYFGSHFIAPS